MMSVMCLSISLFVCVLVGERVAVIPATSLYFLPQKTQGAHYITQNCVRQLDTHTDTHTKEHLDAKYADCIPIYCIDLNFLC